MTHTPTKSPAYSLPSRFSALWICVPSVLGFIGILYHEWWRDEAYTWLVVGSSGTLRELVTNLGFNGHPRAYYFFAWALRQLWTNPFALSLSNVAFALAGIFLFVRSAPVTRFQAALFSLGFYPLYQYGIITRSYSLLILLLFLYCHLRVTRPNARVARLIVLAVLAQVHLASMIAAAVLLIFDWLVGARSPRWRAQEWAAAAVVVVSLALSAWQMLPDKGAPPSYGATDIVTVFNGFANAFVPNYGILNEGDLVQRLLQLGIGLFLFVGSFAMLWPLHRGLLVYSMLAGGMLAECVFVYSGYRWHHGLYFIFMVAALWLSAEHPLRGVRAQFLNFVLALQVIVGLYALGADILSPYSDGRLASRFLRERGLDRLPIVGMSVLRVSRDTAEYKWETDQIQPVLLGLDRTRIFDPVRGSFESFYRHYTEPESLLVMNGLEIDRSLQGVAARLGGPFIVVLMGYKPPNVRLLEKLTDLPRTLDYGERYSLFLCSGFPTTLSKGTQPEQ